MSQQKVHPEETPACCCVDFGTVIDNSDCTVKYDNAFSSKEDAEEMLTKLTDKAHSIESDPCQIEHAFSAENDSTRLQASFVFACATERMIFQLALR